MTRGMVWIAALAVVFGVKSFAEEAAGGASSRGPVSLGVTANRGPSTQEGSFVVPVAANARCISILTQEESVNEKPDGSPYIFVGIPDGLGMFDNGDGTMTVLCNQELGGRSTGIARRHHGANLLSEGKTGFPIATIAGVTADPTNFAGTGLGAFVSRWVINHTNLTVLKGEDQDRAERVSLWDFGATPRRFQNTVAGITGITIPAIPMGSGSALSRLTFARLCSADLAAGTAFRNSITTSNAALFQFATAAPTGVTFGTRNRIFLTGEEDERIVGKQRAFARIVNGPNDGLCFELPGMGRLAWENLVACPAEQDKTVVIGLDDAGLGATNGFIAVWVGLKNANSSSSPVPKYDGTSTTSSDLAGQGTDADQAGLIKGTLYVIKANGLAIEDVGTGAGGAKGVDLPFTLIAMNDQSLPANYDTRTECSAKGGTAFLRPEDGAWDPVRKNVFYFVTTHQFDTIKNPEGVNKTDPSNPAGGTRPVNNFTPPRTANPAGQTGRSRLWRLTFTDITKPEDGGKIALLLDGTEQQQMMDNLCVDARGENILVQEDPGGNDYLAKVLNYNIKSGALTTVAQFDPARFDPAVAINNAASERLITTDEEASGIIDCTSTLGTGWFLMTVQPHASRSGEAVERGQLVAFFNPASAAPPAVNTTSSTARLSSNPASPNVGVVATITVIGTTTTGGSILWEVDFGDGSAPFKATAATASGAAFSTQKTYAAMGVYTITATGTDTLSGQKTVQTLKVTVKDTIRSGVARLRLDFKGGKDDVQVTGALPLPVTTTLAGDVIVDIGGFQKTFTVNEKGDGRDGKNAFKIFKKRKGEGILTAQSRFFVKLFDQDLKPALVDEGLIDKNADRESKSVRVVITVQGIPYDATLTVIYIAQQGKRGFTR